MADKVTSPKNRRRDFSIVPTQPRASDGAGADVPPAAVDEPMEMAAPTVERLRVTSPYAFYTDDGAFCAWPEGAIVTDPAEIELLTGRKAPVERIEA